MLKQMAGNKKAIAIGAGGIALIGAGIWLVRRKFGKRKRHQQCLLVPLFQQIAAKYGMAAVFELIDGLKTRHGAEFDHFDDDDAYDEDYEYGFDDGDDESDEDDGYPYFDGFDDEGSEGKNEPYNGYMARLQAETATEKERTELDG